MARKRKSRRLSRGSKKYDSAGLFIPAGLFLGMGIGFLAGNLAAGIFLGLGVGFALLAIAKVNKR